MCNSENSSKFESNLRGKEINPLFMNEPIDTIEWPSYDVSYSNGVLLGPQDSDLVTFKTNGEIGWPSYDVSYSSGVLHGPQNSHPITFKVSDESEWPSYDVSFSNGLLFNPQSGDSIVLKHEEPATPFRFQIRPGLEERLAELERKVEAKEQQYEELKTEWVAFQNVVEEELTDGLATIQTLARHVQLASESIRRAELRFAKILPPQWESGDDFRPQLN